MNQNNNTPQFLRNLWYVATTSDEVKRNKTTAKQFLGETVLLGRDDNGKVFAMQNICPHRGVPLTDGKFDGQEIECCYHGWRFNTAGSCTKIPSLTPCQRLDISRIKVFSYPIAERNGLVWIFMKDPINPISHETIPVPTDGFLTDQHYQLKVQRIFPCDIDHAAIGLMDPAHGPFVHRSWWWRTPKTIHEKHKPFGPFRYGFQMREHKPSKNSKAYKILGGGEKTTEITFQLPGVRIEKIKMGDKNIFNVTTLTPIDANTTEIRNLFYTPFAFINLIKPVLRRFAYNFLDQDLRIIQKQKTGLKYDPKLMLINDADMQAKWYFRIKYELYISQKEQREFVNPVEETTLKWCS
jgi:phenylpropionate dioxygenase-like ring-hydroxylating dioxygenase large terminal subunit